MSGVWLPSHRMRVVSATLGSGVSVLPVTAREVRAAPPWVPPGGAGTSLALTMMVRGPSTTMPASDGSPSDTRLMAVFSWSTRLLPLRTQIASPASSMAPARLGAGTASSGIFSFSIPSDTALVAPGRPDASSNSFATGAFLFTLHDESTTIEAATALSARPGRQPPMSSSLLPLVPVRVTEPVRTAAAGSPSLPGGYPPNRVRAPCPGRPSSRPGPDGHPPRRVPSWRCPRLDHLLISIVSECEANRLEARGERQPLGVLGGDPQRDRRHLDRLLVLLLDALARREHLHVLQDHLALLVRIALGLPGDDDVDVAQRRDEAADAGHAVDPDRHAAHPLGDHQREEAGALRDQGLLEDRLVPLDRDAGDAADYVLRRTRRTLGLRLDRPRHQLHLIDLDARADRDLVGGDHHVDRWTVPRVADLGDLLLQVAHVPDAHGSRQRPDENRHQKDVTRLHSPTTLPSSGLSNRPPLQNVTARRKPSRPNIRAPGAPRR